MFSEIIRIFIFAHSTLWVWASPLEAHNEFSNTFNLVQHLKGDQPPRVDADFHWSYRGTSGPSYWQEHYPLCAGDNQSPIDIITAETQHQYSWQPFTFHNFDIIPTGMTIMNNGHTVTVYAEMDSPATIQGGELNGEYIFDQFHFHWGSYDFFGSEHAIDSRPYPNEIHLVYFKSIYGSFTEAKHYEDGLAVLGIFLEIDPFDNPKLDNIVNGIEEIRHFEPGITANISPFALQDVLPANVNEIYRYSGSLTTPTCNEAVTWTLFKDTVKISPEQMVKFRELKDDTGYELVDNYRPLQALNGRTVYYAELS